MLAFFKNHPLFVTAVWVGVWGAVARSNSPGTDRYLSLVLLLIAGLPPAIYFVALLRSKDTERVRDAFARTVRAIFLLSVGVIAVYAVARWWEASASQRDRWFPRWTEGDCYVTILDTGAPLVRVSHIITRAPNGEYLVRDEGRPDLRTMSEADFQNDESRFHLRFQKVKCR